MATGFRSDTSSAIVLLQRWMGVEVLSLVTVSSNFELWRTSVTKYLFDESICLLEKA